MYITTTMTMVYINYTCLWPVYVRARTHVYIHVCVCVYVVCVFLQQIAQSLQTMLDYEGDDFEETFMASFQVSFSDMFDNVQTVNLREGGDQIPVTLENRKVQ